MKTIEKILGYKPFSKSLLELFKAHGLYNGMGSDTLNFDNLLREVIEKLSIMQGFDKEKEEELFDDLQQFFARHDIEYVIKVNKLYSDYRLARDIWKLLYWANWKVRYGASLSVFFALTFSKEAHNTYNT